MHPLDRLYTIKSLIEVCIASLGSDMENTKATSEVMYFYLLAEVEKVIKSLSNRRG